MYVYVIGMLYLILNLDVQIPELLPIMGNPFGPGGYGGLRRILDTKPNSNINGTTSMTAIWNGWSSRLAMVCGF